MGHLVKWRQGPGVASLPQGAGGWQKMRVSKWRKHVPMREDPGSDCEGIHLGPWENHGKLKETRLGGEMLVYTA